MRRSRAVQTTWDSLEAPRARRKAVVFDDADWTAALTQELLIRVGSTKDCTGKSEQTIQREIIKGLRAFGVRVKHTPNAVRHDGELMAFVLAGLTST
jgi:hypothetical protein